jgi:hypothetical protein
MVGSPACVASNGLKPCLFPKYQAAGLTATIGFPVAAVLQMNPVRQASTAGAGRRITGLVRPLIDLKALAAVFEHLRHERETVESAILVERL